MLRRFLTGTVKGNDNVCLFACLYVSLMREVQTKPKLQPKPKPKPKPKGINSQRITTLLSREPH